MAEQPLDSALRQFHARREDYERFGPDGGWTALAVKSAWLDFVDVMMTVSARLKPVWRTEEIARVGFGGGVSRIEHD